MIYMTTGITNTIMNAVEGTGTPQQDFDYMLKYKPIKYPRNEDKEAAKSKSGYITDAKNNGKYFIAGKLKQTYGMYSRNNASLESRSLIVLDIDETELSLDELYKHLLDKIGDTSFLLYPTASHSDEATKARVVILPDRFIAKYEYSKVVSSLKSKIGIDIDKATETWSQHMGLPLTYEGLEEDFKVYSNHGNAYLIDKAFDDYRENGYGKDDTNTVDERDSNKVLAEGTRNSGLFNRGMSLQKSGIEDEKIQGILYEVNEKYCVPPLATSEVDSIFRSVTSYPKGNINTMREGNIVIKEGKYCRISYGKNGEQYLPITNFIMEPISITEYVDTKADDFVEVDIILENGGRLRKKLNASSFNDVQSFKNAIGTFKTSYTGTKEDLQSIKVLVNRGSAMVIRAYSCGGIHKIDGEWRFVSTEGTLDRDDLINNNIIHSNNDGLKTGIENETPITRDDLIRISEYLFSFNSKPIVIAILLYISSIFLKERLYEELGIKYPHLIIAGEAGAGKSATVKYIISKVLNIIGPEHSASGITKFTADKYLSSNNTVPYIIEEYKPDYLKIQSMQDISNIARSSYDRQISSRGKKDGTIDKYPLLAPIVIVGESSFSETAIVERSIMLTFSKKDSKENFDSFNEIQGIEELGELGRSILNSSLNISMEELKNQYNSYHKKVDESEKLKVDRLKNHMCVLMLGHDVLESVYQGLGLNLEEISGISKDDAIEILSDIIISENLNNNSNSKTSIDITLELMADAYYNRFGPNPSNILRVTSKEDRKLLALNLKKLHPVMSKYVRDFNISSRFLTIEDLRKQISRAPYFVSIDGKDTYKINYNGTSGMFTLLDIELLKQAGIEFDLCSSDW